MSQADTLGSWLETCILLETQGACPLEVEDSVYALTHSSRQQQAAGSASSLFPRHGALY